MRRSCDELRVVAARGGAELKPGKTEPRVARGAAAVSAAEREVAHRHRVAGLRRPLVVIRSRQRPEAGAWWRLPPGRFGATAEQAVV